ncbi:hypothetical protein [Pseudomonas viridiflava]|uniref:hypothetical protein n=1 Tax=Pseudomonas viridiflava TaxID=33069 RepID=UPI002B1DE39B|nr:hypothetical protein [Pseudomonas viridiflava]
MDRTIQSAQTFTHKQGQYLAFIHAYTLVDGHALAQAGTQRFFKVTPTSVHRNRSINPHSKH